MATKSIFETLKTLTTETSVPAMGTDENGKTILVSHNLPERLFPTDEIFESETDLVGWANKKGYTFALLQMGLQAGLIDLRARFKACRKGDTWSPEYGQTNIDGHEWTPCKRPNQSGKANLDQARFNDCLAMIVKLTDAGMDLDTIKAMTVSIYGDNVVNAIIDTLK